MPKLMLDPLLPRERSLTEIIYRRSRRLWMALLPCGILLWTLGFCIGITACAPSTSSITRQDPPAISAAAPSKQICRIPLTARTSGCDAP